MVEAEFCSIVCSLVSFRFVSTRWFRQSSFTFERNRSLPSREGGREEGGRGGVERKKVWFAKVVASRLFHAR